MFHKTEQDRKVLTEQVSENWFWLTQILLMIKLFFSVIFFVQNRQAAVLAHIILWRQRTPTAPVIISFRNDEGKRMHGAFFDHYVIRKLKNRSLITYFLDGRCWIASDKWYDWYNCINSNEQCLSKNKEFARCYQKKSEALWAHQGKTVRWVLHASARKSWTHREMSMRIIQPYWNMQYEYCNGWACKVFYRSIW